MTRRGGYIVVELEDGARVRLTPKEVNELMLRICEQHGVELVIGDRADPAHGVKSAFLIGWDAGLRDASDSGPRGGRRLRAVV